MQSEGCQREIAEKIREEGADYVLSVKGNRLYWFLDVCFGEDDCRARRDHAAEDLNVLRETAQYLLRKTSVPEKRFSLSRKMLRATLSDDFLHDVLFGKVK